MARHALFAPIRRFRCAFSLIATHSQYNTHTQQCHQEDSDSHDSELDAFICDEVLPDENDNPDNSDDEVSDADTTDTTDF